MSISRAGREMAPGALAALVPLPSKQCRSHPLCLQAAWGPCGTGVLLPSGLIGASWRGDSGDGAAQRGHGQLPSKPSRSISQEQPRLPLTSASKNISQSSAWQKQQQVSAPLLCFIAAGKQLLSLKKRKFCLRAALLDAFTGLPRGCRLSRGGHSCSHRLCLLLPLRHTPLPAFHLSPSLTFPFPLFMLSSGRAQASVGGGIPEPPALSPGSGFLCWLLATGPRCPLGWDKMKEKRFPRPPLLFARICLSCAPSFLLGGELSYFQ